MMYNLNISLPGGAYPCTDYHGNEDIASLMSIHRSGDTRQQ